MKNRLEIAYELLKDDGAIFVHCDDNEQAYLKVLLDDIFGSDNFLNTLSVFTKVSAGASGGGTISGSLRLLHTGKIGRAHV